MTIPPDRLAPVSWSVGDLSRASGLSVRVLRHWEERRLLTADRSPSGQRRYGPDQVTRLFRALALRRTGLGLRRIADLLDETDPDPVSTLHAHLADITSDLRRRSALRDRLAEVLGSLRNTDPATPHGPAERARALLKVIEP